MAKSDIVSAALSAISAGQQQVLSDAVGAAVDAAYAEQKASDGTVTTPSDQATIDALNAQVTDLQTQLQSAKDQDASDVKAGQDAVAAVQAQVTDLQSKLDTAVAADAADKALVSNFQGAIASLQTALDALKAAIPSVP